MENNFDLRKFLAEGSFANSPKQINEDFEGGEQDDQQQQRKQRYGDPCMRLEDQLMDLYDKHGDELLDYIERLMRLTRGGQKGQSMRLIRKFKNIIGFLQIGNKQLEYYNKGCGNPIQFFADYMGADHIVDFVETMMNEDIQENEMDTDVADTLKKFFGLKEGESNEEVAEGESEEYNEEVTEGESEEHLQEEPAKDEKDLANIFKDHGIDDRSFFLKVHDFIFGKGHHRRNGGKKDGNSVDRLIDDLFEKEEE